MSITLRHIRIYTNKYLRHNTSGGSLFSRETAAHSFLTLLNKLPTLNVLFYHYRMYSTFTYPEFFCRLPHRCIMVNDIMCDFYRPLLDIFLHRIPLHSLFLQCMQRNSASFIHLDKRILCPFQ